MNNPKPKSCFITVKEWCIVFYKAPFFWVKAISSSVVLALAAFGLFKIISSAFHYFGEPLSYFDPERLGQLGDFLGGTLNPIFGFATVCLLLWSVFIQRKELSLTRAELNKSSIALEGQLVLATNEYSRKQLEELHKLLCERYEILFTEKFPPQKVEITRNIKPDSDMQYSSYKELKKYLLADLRDGDKVKYVYQDSPSEKQKQIKNQINDLHMKIQLISIEICSITLNESIKVYYKEENLNRESTLRLLHIITN